MGKSAKVLRALAIAIILSLISGMCLSGCYSPSSPKQPAGNTAPASPERKSAPVKKTYSDIPTLFPNLYSYSPDSGLRNVYDESKVVDWSEAANYVGQEVTVEGSVDSVVYAASSDGAPYFYNIGGGAYEGFAIVIWSKDLPRFDQIVLHNDVNWSMSDQPMQFRMRASGVVEIYNGRPQITARDGSQVAQWVNDSWSNMMSDNARDALMESLYR